MPTPIWSCDECGGPAAWTFINGEPHYHCKRGCAGFNQLDMLYPMSYLDRVVSMSGLRQPDPIWSDAVIEEQHQRFHNGS